MMKQGTLPPGWESRKEPSTGKSYFVNHFTYNATLEDPRIRQITEEMESMTLQPKRESWGRSVPMMGASAMQAAVSLPSLPDSLSRIRVLFPTVPDTHIKALLLKYHGREAVVISALQVEKHPVATPGPYTPPPARPHPRLLTRRPPPKPHSPKMKLRLRCSIKETAENHCKEKYLKSVFPVVEETLLLETLFSSDNNVSSATQRLVGMGFDKKDSPRISLSRSREPAPVQPPPPAGPPDRHALKIKLCTKYKEIPERVVLLALDSADYNEKTAETILSFTLKERQDQERYGSETVEEVGRVEEGPAEGETSAAPAPKQTSAPDPPASTDRPDHPPCLLKNEVAAEEKELKYKSKNVGRARGPNQTLVRGPNPALLLADYVPWMGGGSWRGPEPGLARGPQRLARGPDRYLALGPCRRALSHPRLPPPLILRPSHY